MSWITWTLILSGVGLNAAAQLLLKAATRPLAAFSEFDLQSASGAVPALACTSSSSCFRTHALRGFAILRAFAGAGLCFVAFFLAGFFPRVVSCAAPVSYSLCTRPPL